MGLGLAFGALAAWPLNQKRLQSPSAEQGLARMLWLASKAAMAACHALLHVRSFGAPYAQ